MGYRRSRRAQIHLAAPHGQSAPFEAGYPGPLDGERLGDVQAWVGRNIRAIRKINGLSQLVLAERSDLSADCIGKVERGTTSPSIESLKAIATAMNLSLGDLFAGELQAASSQEALIELIGLCRGRTRADIKMLVGIAQLIFQGRGERSGSP
jgi:transcriptional regulator with XRE-family HTH domain